MILKLAQQYDFRRFAVEANQFQEMLADQLSDRARQRGVTLYVEKLNNSTRKQARIEGLEPLVAQGMLLFSRRHQLLLDQLRQFPLGDHDDGPDALEMAVSQCHAYKGNLWSIEEM